MTPEQWRRVEEICNAVIEEEIQRWREFVSIRPFQLAASHDLRQRVPARLAARKNKRMCCCQGARSSGLASRIVSLPLYR